MQTYIDKQLNSTFRFNHEFLDAYIVHFHFTKHQVVRVREDVLRQLRHDLQPRYATTNP